MKCIQQAVLNAHCKDGNEEVAHIISLGTFRNGMHLVNLLYNSNRTQSCALLGYRCEHTAFYCLMIKNVLLSGGNLAVTLLL